jgi:hypothetical protein
MTSYNKGDWFSKSEARKSVRDEVRKAFWARCGGDPHRQAKTLEYTPKEHRVSLLRLMQVTRDASGDKDVAMFLGTVGRSLASTGLGKGLMGDVGRNVEDLSRFHTRVLEHFFAYAYKLEGRRNKDGTD